MRRIATNMGVEYDFCTTADPEAFAKKMKPNTRLVWIESPTNPLLQVRCVLGSNRVSLLRQGQI